MPWFKVDDMLSMHPKAACAGNSAMGLWVRAGSWCAQHLTNGHLPAHAARALGTKREAQRLVDAGLWREVADGYEFHDWFDFQPSADESDRTRQDIREKRRAAGRKGAAARWGR